jgi:hypothetical protein
VFGSATAIADFHGAGDVHRNCGAIERGRKDQVGAASLIDEILQTGTVESQVKGVGAGNVEVGAIGASREDSNGETGELAGRRLRRLIGSRLVYGHHSLFGEYLLQGVMKAVRSRRIERTEVKVDRLDSFDAEGGEESLGKAASGGEQERKANQKNGEGSSPGEAPAGREYPSEKWGVGFERGEICPKPRESDLGIRFGERRRPVKGGEMSRDAQRGGRKGASARAADRARSHVSLEFGGLDGFELLIMIGAQGVVSGAVHETS